jgi:hypothetical protein
MDTGCHAHWRCPKQVYCLSSWPFFVWWKERKIFMTGFLAPKQPSTEKMATNVHGSQCPYVRWWVSGVHMCNSPNVYSSTLSSCARFVSLCQQFSCLLFSSKGVFKTRNMYKEPGWTDETRHNGLFIYTIRQMYWCKLIWYWRTTQFSQIGSIFVVRHNLSDCVVRL